MTDSSVSNLTVTAAAARIARSVTGSDELVGACLDRIVALEPRVHASTCLDRERALEQASKADGQRKEGKGVPRSAARDRCDGLTLPRGE